MSSKSPRYYALIPAAGIGARMEVEVPKQYLSIAGKPMLQYVLDTFSAMPEITHTFVVVSADDGYIAGLMAAAPYLADRVTILRHGGESRHLSVLNGLAAMRGLLHSETIEDDWVLVHDAARPGLTPDMVLRLMDTLRDDAVGGLLALPVADTVKRSVGSDVGTDVAKVLATVARADLWTAQTPQMFRYQLLQQALANALEKDEPITDDASAVEMLGLQPCLVVGSPMNFKVTLPHDVALAELFLK
ncbi:MAG: 2-C-methyl-D-erythritol 4-phosphate cytidylyltransferase [Glaciimonas sp.]|nr:2-C-methyl-D-erythritol 4-phosphate cytidylyltransferase [Glaciimonas sp.]